MAVTIQPMIDAPIIPKRKTPKKQPNSNAGTRETRKARIRVEKDQKAFQRLQLKSIVGLPDRRPAKRGNGLWGGALARDCEHCIGVSLAVILVAIGGKLVRRNAHP